MVSGVIGKRDEKISLLCFTVSVQLFSENKRELVPQSIYKKWCNIHIRKTILWENSGVWTGKTFLRICLPIESSPCSDFEEKTNAISQGHKNIRL